MGWDWHCLEECGPFSLSRTATEAYTACFEDCIVSSGYKQVDDVTAQLPVWAALLSSAGLVILSGLFSGLTLGLLSLDLVGLRILAKGGDSDERLYASRIIPVREHGNLLLCTLLLGNTATNSAISILLSGITSGAVGLLVSTFVILILGEIMPQAVCSRHSLYLGSKVIIVVKLFMLLFLPICYPLAFVLDQMLGRDIGTVYSQEELKRLIDIHVEDPVAQAESGLTITDHRLLTGVLGYKDKIVRDVMTKIDDAFLLEKTMRLNFHTLSRVYVSGCSRIPVFEGERGNIVGILFVKDLVLVDPDDEMEVGTVMAFRGRSVSRVYDSVTLDKVFLKFMASSNHMLIAHEPPPDVTESQVTPITQTRVTGLITLEDVLEEMINSEIYDESDEYEKALRQRDKTSVSQRNDVSMYLNLFDPKMRGNRLSPQEMQAVFAFLTHEIEEFRPLSASELAFKGLIRTAEVVERSASNPTGGGPAPTAGASGCAVQPPTFADLEEEHGQRFWQHAAQAGAMMYERGRPSAYFTLILQGKVLIRTGSEAFELDLGPWSHLGNKALVLDLYLPDFDAVAVAPYRILRIHRGAYRAAMDASRLDTAREFQAVKQQMRMQVTDGLSPLPPLPPSAPTHGSSSGRHFVGGAAPNKALLGCGTVSQHAVTGSLRSLTNGVDGSVGSGGGLFGSSTRLAGGYGAQPRLEVELAALDEPSLHGWQPPAAPTSREEERALLLPPAISPATATQSYSRSTSLARVSPEIAGLLSSPKSHSQRPTAAPLTGPQRRSEDSAASSEGSAASSGHGGGREHPHAALLPRGSSNEDVAMAEPAEAAAIRPSASLKAVAKQSNATLMQLFTSDLPFGRRRNSAADEHSAGGPGAGGGCATAANSHTSGDASEGEKEWPAWEAVDAKTFGPPSDELGRQKRPLGALTHSHSMPVGLRQSGGTTLGGMWNPEGGGGPMRGTRQVQPLRDRRDQLGVHQSQQPHAHQQCQQPPLLEGHRRHEQGPTQQWGPPEPGQSLSFSTASDAAGHVPLGAHSTAHSAAHSSGSNSSGGREDVLHMWRNTAANRAQQAMPHAVVTVLPPGGDSATGAASHGEAGSSCRVNMSGATSAPVSLAGPRAINEATACTVAAASQPLSIAGSSTDDDWSMFVATGSTTNAPFGEVMSLGAARTLSDLA